MSRPNDPILQAALSLPPDERARLADHLQASLDEGRADLDPSEIQHRIDALRRGDSTLLREVEQGEAAFVRR